MHCINISFLFQDRQCFPDSLTAHLISSRQLVLRRHTIPRPQFSPVDLLLQVMMHFIVFQLFFFH